MCIANERDIVLLQCMLTAEGAVVVILVKRRRYEHGHSGTSTDESPAFNDKDTQELVLLRHIQEISFV